MMSNQISECCDICKKSWQPDGYVAFPCKDGMVISCMECGNMMSRCEEKKEKDDLKTELLEIKKLFLHMEECITTQNKYLEETQKMLRLRDKQIRYITKYCPAMKPLLDKFNG